MSSSTSLIEKLHQTSGFSVMGVEKEDLAEAIFDLYRNDDKKAMSALFTEYTNFLFRGSKQAEEPVLERAKGNIRFVSYVADLMAQNCSLFEALDKAAKQDKDLRCGPVVDFFKDSIHNYALVKMSGFHTMYNGALYSRRAELEDIHGVYEFAIMSRYGVPTAKQIVEHLQQKELNYRVVEDDVHNFLAAKKLIPGKDYLDLAYGRVPGSFLRENVDNIKGLYCYELALRQEVWKNQPQFGLQWNLRSLPYHNRLPSRDLVLMKELSDLERQDANKTVDALYEAISTSLHFTNVFDSSVVRLESLALELMESLPKIPRNLLN